MIMKREYLTAISIILAVLFPASLFAQKAQVKVGFDYRVKLGGSERKEDYILLTGQHGSEFYNPTALWMDLNSKDETACQAYGVMASQLADAGRHDEIPNRSVSMYVFKDFDKKDKTVYDDYSDQFAKYNEPFEQMQWQIFADSTEKVLNYECLMAKSAYHGRNWTVWFAPEIPIHDGPWKFAGLPGLILKAIESQGIHSFIANGIETVDLELPGMPRDDWYSKEDRIKFLQGRRKYLQDPLAGIFGGAVPANIKLVVNGKETTIGELRKQTSGMLDAGYDFLETDYRR